MNRYKTSLLILLPVFAFSFLLYNSFKTLDNDLGWHLKTGEDIYKEKSVPATEKYNYTLSGKNWVDHEWSMNLLSYFIFKKYGYISLSAFFALLAFLILFIQTIFIKKFFPKSALPVIIFLQLFGLLAMSPYLGVRLQEITVLFLLLELIIIHRFLKRKNIRSLNLLIPLFILWANTHAGFLIGLFVLSLFVLYSVLCGFCSDYEKTHDIKQATKNIFRKKQNWLIIIFFLLSFSATLVNPYGLKLYGFLENYSDTYYLKNILEWLPFYAYPIHYLQLIYLAFSLSMIILIICGKIKHRKYSEQTETMNTFWYLFLSAIFIFLALKSKRNFPLFYIASFPLLISFLHDVSERISFLKKHHKNILEILLCIILLVCSVFFLENTGFTDKPFENPKYCIKYPCKAVAFLKNNPLTEKSRIFNNFDWGGYLLWVYPEKKIFIDGRLPVYKYKSHSLLEEYHQFFYKEKTGEKLKEYGIDTVLMKKREYISLKWWEEILYNIKEEKLNKKKNVLKYFLDSSSDWRLVYDDEISSIYIKPQITSAK